MENAEGALARRVQHEREKRSWSYEKLAKAMHAAGVRIGASALWKIENQSPRRTISVDEAVGFAKVFDVPLEQLLVPPELAADQELHELATDFLVELLDLGHAASDCGHTGARLGRLLKEHPEAADTVVSVFTHEFSRNPHRDEAIRLLLDWETFEARGPWQAFEMLFTAEPFTPSARGARWVRRTEQAAALQSLKDEEAKARK